MFDRWASPLASTFPLKDLENSMGEGRPLKIGIDAEHFLRKFAGKEPLNGALGGDPFLLESRIMSELNQLKKMNCALLFFFHGVEYGPSTDAFSAANKAVETNSAAFAKYEEKLPEEAIKIFKNNDFLDIASVLAWLKATLARNGIPSITAPFSAYAQMVDAFNESSIDMYYASTEIFLFGAGQIITGFDMKVENHRSTGLNGEDITSPHVNVDASTFQLLDLEILASAHLRVPEGLVKDVMILAGSSLLPTFQQWADAASSSSFGFAEASNVLSRWDGDILGLIESSTIENKRTYWEQYTQVATAIQYMPVLHHMNEVTVTGRRKDVPVDLQTALGLHLPDELNYYLFTGLIAPKMLNWLNAGKILIKPPFDGGDAVYKKLVKDTLHTWRRQNYSLLVSNFNRYFHKRPVSTEYWFETSPSPDNTFTDETPVIDRSPLSQWQVKDAEIGSKSSALGLKRRSLPFAFESLLDASFAAKTIHVPPSKEVETDILKSGDEIISNAVWRALFVRGYIDKQHKLSPWGKMAQTALSKSGQSAEQNEAVFVAIELLRAKVLSPKAILAESKSTETSQKYTEFIAKVMCVGSMAHLAKGYSGPLSRSLLAFHSSVNAMRSSLRDLMEVVLVSILLWGEGERVRDDYTELARDLPFRGRFSCGLGIYISTYLDQYHEHVQYFSSAAELNEKLKRQMQGFVAHSHVDTNFERINQIWDALIAAVKVSGELVDRDDKKLYEDIDAWFSRRRPGTTNPMIPNGA